MVKYVVNKNLIQIKGKEYFKRWTILGVDSEVVLAVRMYAKSHGVTTSRALSEIVTSSKKIKDLIKEAE